MRLLMIVCGELIVVLVLLILLTKVFPDNPVTKAITNLVSASPEVILDAGHGGYDSGSVYESFYEKDITLAITKKVGVALQNKGVKVAYTRESDNVSWPSDELQDLTKRVEISNKSNAYLFVSIHTNASEANDAFGFEIWGKIKNEKTFALAKHVMQRMEAANYTQNRGIKDQDLNPLQVLESNRLPAILIETGFLANDQDRSYLTNELAQQKIADAIAQGIYDELQELKKE